MELESLFSSTRWEILKELSKQKLSPMELADILKTTSANVSQQLRLLELAGLVNSEKTSNVEKGKPRVIYTLAGKMAFLILTSPFFTNKKLLNLDHYHNFVMRGWFLENTEHHPLVSSIYNKLNDYFEEISVVAVQSGLRELNLFIIAADKELNAVLKKDLSKLQKVRLNIISLEDFKKKRTPDIVVLHDPKFITETEVMLD